MCFSVTPTSLRAGESTDITICCDTHLGTPTGTWWFISDDGTVIDFGSFPTRRTLFPGESRDSIINPGDIDPGIIHIIRRIGGGTNPSAPCATFTLIAPYTATRLEINGRCVNPDTRVVICTETKVLPVYVDTSPGGHGNRPPPNARIPEPFRRADATPEVANDPLAWE